jgi:hypothetical protein
VGFIGLLSADATAQSKTPSLTDPTPQEIAYGFSFYMYDTCGDSEAGQIFRRAIIEQLDRCSFSPEAKAKFQAWRIETLEALVSRLIKPGSDFNASKVLKDVTGGTNPDGSAKTCSEYRATPEYIERRAKLLQYQRGEISLEKLLGPACPSGPASL